MPMKLSVLQFKSIQLKEILSNKNMTRIKKLSRKLNQH